MVHTLNTFTHQSRLKHGNKYDYSLVNYVNNKTKVKIICPIHGEFEQEASTHMKGSGCSVCSGKARITEQEFFKRALETHGDKYDYSRAVYKGWTKDIIIGCDKHGFNSIRAEVHVKNKGCNRCSLRALKTKEEVLKEFEEAHGKTYDYSKFEYITTETKSVIICKIHGEFLQIPKAHKKGIGCPTCGSIRGNTINAHKKGFYCIPRAERHKEKWTKKKATLYFVKIITPTEEFYKVGITVQTLKKRFIELKRENSTYKEIYSIETNLYDACYKEHDIIERYKEYKYTPKTKMKSGNTECFSLELDINR